MKLYKIFFNLIFSYFSAIVTEKLGNVVTIGINRPEKRNCVDDSTAQQLSKAIEEFENDDSLKVAVLHGTGGNFCAGYDLKALSELKELPQTFFQDTEHGQMVGNLLR